MHCKIVVLIKSPKKREKHEYKKPKKLIFMSDKVVNLVHQLNHLILLPKHNRGFLLYQQIKQRNSIYNPSDE